MFTKEHYIAVAKVLKKYKRRSDTALHLWWLGTIVQDFVELFKENPKFDKERFLDEVYRKEESK